MSHLNRTELANAIYEMGFDSFLPKGSPALFWVENFIAAILIENENQNLTRIANEAEFVDLNLRDCIELTQLLPQEGWIADLGTGMGIPGLLLAGIDLTQKSKREWILVESEKRKCEFLSKIVQNYNLTNTRVLHGRIEENSETFNSLKNLIFVSRALARVEKIEKWLKKCSTWNTLILLKSRGWEEEWSSYLKFQIKKEKEFQLRLTSKHEYFTKRDSKYRNIITLNRNVPRGTL